MFRQSRLKAGFILVGAATYLLTLICLQPITALGQPDSNRFERDIERLEANIFDPPPGPIVFYGSSSFRLWKSLEKDFSSYEVLNCGFGGGCVSGLVAFSGRLLLSLTPSAAFIYFGYRCLAVT